MIGTHSDNTIHLCDICLLHIDKSEYKENDGVCNDCKYELDILQKELTEYYE